MPSKGLKKIRVQLKQHICKLKSPLVDIVEERTPHGVLYKFRKWLRRFTMSSENDCMTLWYLKSISALRIDRQRHYENHFWTIHPLSKANAHIEQFYIILFISSMYVYPMGISTNHSRLRTGKLIWDIMYFLHIILSFFIGYIDKNTRKVILDKKLIAKYKKYIKYHFFLEAISSWPFGLTVYIRNKKFSWMAIFGLLKIVRFSFFNTCLVNTETRYEIPSRLIILLKLFVIYLMALCINAAVLLLVSAHYPETLDWTVDPNGSDFQFIKGIYTVSTIIMSSGYGHSSERHLPGMLMEILFMFIGSIIFYLTVGLLWYITLDYQRCKTAYRNLIKELDKFCYQKELSDALKKRLRTYYSFRFQDIMYKNEILRSILTPTLQKEITIAKYLKMLYEVQLFKILPLHILEQFAMTCKNEIYLANDTIVNKGRNYLFMIRLGTVAVFSSHKLELCHLEDNSYFGDLNMVLNTGYLTATAVAVSCCEIVILKRYDFEMVMAPYVDLTKRLMKRAEELMEKNVFLMMRLNVDVLLPQYFIDELLKSRSEIYEDTTSGADFSLNIRRTTI